MTTVVVNHRQMSKSYFGKDAVYRGIATLGTLFVGYSLQVELIVYAAMFLAGSATASALYMALAPADVNVQMHKRANDLAYTRFAHKHTRKR